MKKILNFLANFFQKNGLLKILGAFIILAISALLIQKFGHHSFSKIFAWTGAISGGYLILSVLIFTIAGIINSINDTRKR